MVAWDDSSATAPPAQNPEQSSDQRVTGDVHKLLQQMSDERVMTALHTMQDHLQQTIVMTQQIIRSENTVSKTKEDAAYEPMPRTQQEDARRTYDQKCNEAAVAETNCTNAKQDVLEVAEALEKPVAKRAGSLLITVVEWHEAAQNHLERAFSTAISGEKCSGKCALAAPAPLSLERLAGNLHRVCMFFFSAPPEARLPAGTDHPCRQPGSMLCVSRTGFYTRRDLFFSLVHVKHLALRVS